MLPPSSTYYASTAYNPEHIPNQPEEPYRSWLLTMGKHRLPWGNTSRVLVPCYLNQGEIDALRLYNDSTKEEIQQGRVFAEAFGGIFDHEAYREPNLTLKLKILLFFYSVGRVFSIILVPLSILVFFFSMYKLGDKFNDYLTETYQFLTIFCGIPLSIWLISAIIIKCFTKFFFSGGRGAKWELNRRRGEVIIYRHKKGQKIAIKRPFYEFDAYIGSTPNRQGIMMYRLYLAHRYEHLYLSLENLQELSYSKHPLFAVWDFLQNYMDTTQPMPDCPILEKFRHLDPTTRDYDQQTGRDPHYWANMDKATLKQKINENNQLIASNNMHIRSNIMSKHVKYNYT